VLEILPFTESHVAPFTACFNALPNNDVWTEEFVRSRTVQDSTYDPALMIAIHENDTPVGFLLGSIANETGWIRAFLVRKDHRRRGIGTMMFEAIEYSLAERGIAEINVGWAPPRYFLPGIDITYTPAIVFLDRRGYQTKRETRVNMDVPLIGRSFDTTDDEARLRERGFAFRRARPSDRPGITHLCETHHNLGWALEAGMALDKDPIAVFIAERHGEICAFAAHRTCGPIYFGPMLTSAELRGLGIGSVLLKRCLQDWQQMGVERCEIMWAGPLSFYARSVGATIGRAFWTFHKSLS
jgi:mycothiol synthase